MEDDLDGLDVGGENDKFTNTSVEGFGGFVGSVRQLKSTRSGGRALGTSRAARR